MDKIKLRAYDGIAIAGFLTLFDLFYTTPGMVTGQSGPAAWIAVLFAHFVILAVFMLTVPLIRRYGGKDIIAIASELLGRTAGALYGLLFSLYFCFFTGISIREYAELLKIYGLPLTPVYVLAGFTLLAGLAMNWFGGRSLIKSAGFFFIIVVSGIILILLVGLNRYNPDYLFPVLGGGVEKIATGGRYIASIASGALALLLFSPDFTDASAYKKAGVTALILSAVLSSLFYLCLVMTFSASVASEMVSGFMEFGKSIYYNHFFYRFESLMLFFLIFSVVITAAIGLYIARKSAASVLRLESGKIPAVVCAVVIALIAAIPQNLLDLTNRYLKAIGRYGVFFMAGVPLLLWAVNSMRRISKHEKV